MKLKPYNPKEFKVICLRECAPVDATTDNPELVVKYWRDNIPSAPWFDPCKESAVVIMFNTRKRVLGHNLVSIGLLDQTLVYPREVFRPAIAIAASAIVLVHNHPSGDPTPSEGDIRLSRGLLRAGDLLKIDLLDSIIIGGERHTSLRAHGFLE